MVWRVVVHYTLHSLRSTLAGMCCRCPFYPLLYPRTTKLLGVYCFHLDRPSVRLYRIRSVAPTVLVGSISYLYILLSNFRRCFVCKVPCKISKFDIFFLICNFDFVFCWFGIWYEWITTMGNHGVAGVSQNAGVLVVLVCLLHVR